MKTTGATLPILVAIVSLSMMPNSALGSDILPKELVPIVKQVVAEAPSRQTASVKELAPNDPDFAENRSIRESKSVNHSGRTIYAWHTWYGVVSADGKMGYYYDNSDGKLTGFDYYIGKQLPKKTFGYSYPEGKLVSLGVFAKSDVFYEISRAGKVISCVKGNYACDANGQPKPGKSAQRKIFFPK